MKDAPFDKRDAHLVPAAGSCSDCAKRTGHNKLLFGDDFGRQGDRCVDPKCYQSKIAAHVAKTVAAKPQLVQISTAYGTQKEGSPVLPRNKYTAIRDDKPKSNDEAKRPEFKVCKFTTDAIITEGGDVGTVHKVCANPTCPVHHAKQPTRASANDAQFKAQQEKQRREEAIAASIGIRTLAAISAAVPVRLMKRDLLFVTERLATSVDERRLEIVAKQRGIKRENDSDSVGKLFGAYLRRAEEGVLGSVLVELTILLTAARQQTAQVLKDAAAVYKVDTDAIAAKVKQEFAAKHHARTAKRAAPKPPAKVPSKPVKKAAA